MSDVFSPQKIADAVRAQLSESDVTPADGKSHAIVTSYDGKSVRAAYAWKINNTWHLAGEIEWHGGEPQVGMQVHASW